MGARSTCERHRSEHLRGRFWPSSSVGCCKSTLLHCMGTLDLPSSGDPAGGELTTMSGSRLAAVRNRTSLRFQFHHLLPEFTASRTSCPR